MRRAVTESVVLGAALIMAAPTAASASPSHTGAGTGTLATAPLQELRKDVDGDGKADTVTVTHVDDEFARLTITTARGATASTLYERTPSTLVTPLLGVVPMDGNPGAEIITRTALGTHTVWYKVFTWKNNKIVPVASPDTKQVDWWIDGGAGLHGTTGGWNFRITKGKRYLERRQFTNNADSFSVPPSKITYTAVTTTFTWAKGAWVKVSATRAVIKYSAKAFKLAVGWHGLGTPDH